MMVRPLILSILFFVSCPVLQGTTYYLDASGGSDDNAGLSATSAWKTLAKINSSKFAPGDIILLRRGSVWREQLNFPSSGSAGSPIVIDAYGTGELPVISGADLVAAGAWSPCKSCGADIWEAAGEPVVLCGGYACSLALWSPGTGEEHHLWVGSPLWFVRSLPGDRAVVAGSRGIMAVQLTAHLPGTNPARSGKDP